MEKELISVHSTTDPETVIWSYDVTGYSESYINRLGLIINSTLKDGFKADYAKSSKDA